MNMYIIFEDGEFKTIGNDNDVKELLSALEENIEPYEIFELGELNPARYTEFVPNFYGNRWEEM